MYTFQVLSLCKKFANFAGMFRDKADTLFEIAKSVEMVIILEKKAIYPPPPSPLKF